MLLLTFFIYNEIINMVETSKRFECDNIGNVCNVLFVYFYLYVIAD